MEDMGMTDKFPSPFGVRVLKLNIRHQKGSEAAPSFRPLSGFVF